MLRIESVFAIHSWKKNNDFANVILTKLVRKGYWKLSILGCHFIKNHWRLIIDPRRGGGYPLPLNPTPFVPPLSLQPVSAPDRYAFFLRFGDYYRLILICYRLILLKVLLFFLKFSAVSFYLILFFFLFCLNLNFVCLI